MHKQQPQTAYRKDAVLTGTIFENCDKKEDITRFLRDVLFLYREIDLISGLALSVCK
uniref:Uncharacterized protein n=1 Tax=Faecalibacterium prausnitzii TaxID=853 RepID=A0A564SGD2_9FIRM|nr:Uncharacterised protein [Faecalibacterium prausnitzii]